MSELENPSEVGYCKPPKQNQFVKGVSGNPKGRPKGSKNVFSVVLKAGQERITVTQNGKVRTMTKLEASAAQLSNKAAGGDPRATREMLFWSRQAEEALTSARPLDEVEDADRSVMESILMQIRKADVPQKHEPTAGASDDENDGED